MSVEDTPTAPLGPHADHWNRRPGTRCPVPLTPEVRGQPRSLGLDGELRSDSPHQGGAGAGGGAVNEELGLLTAGLETKPPAPVLSLFAPRHGAWSQPRRQSGIGRSPRHRLPGRFPPERPPGRGTAPEPWRWDGPASPCGERSGSAAQPGVGGVTLASLGSGCFSLGPSSVWGEWGPLGAVPVFRCREVPFPEKMALSGACTSSGPEPSQSRSRHYHQNTAGWGCRPRAEPAGVCPQQDT